MTASLRAGGQRQEEILTEAVYRHACIVLNCRIADGWASFHSRLLGTTGEGRQLVAAYPTLDRLCPPEFAGGEQVSVALRRGHKRCLFRTIVIRQCRFSMTRSVHLPALVLAWPDAMYELQRRFYYRVPVPTGTQAAVTLRRVVRSGGAPESCDGMLVDISAGGVSVRMPMTESGWRRDQMVCCRIESLAGEPAIELPARICHSMPEQGGLRVGLQFTELESDPARPEFAQVVRLCQHFQRLPQSA